MSYLVIARKYRPLKFEDVIGQEHVTTTLTNAINNNKVHHAYLLTGPRGVGKTTVSRIIAKALNCEKGVTSDPCGVCSNCKEIDSGNSLDVKEIDGASNRGIDEIRELRDDIKFAPASSRKKIYIIDEVHMLTNQAFNALLKTLEEPPEHAVFIFATTEVNEVPATILSRCQRHDFKRVDTKVLSKALKQICEKEGVSIDEESLLMIAKSGDGSVRDSQSVLDQVIAFSGNEITSESTYRALGLPGLEIFFEFTGLVLSKDTAEMLDYIDRIYKKGINVMSYIKGLMEFFRDLLIIKTSGESKILNLTADNFNSMKNYKDEFGEKDLLLFIDILSRSVSKLKSSPFQRMDLEIVLLKILHHEPVTEIEKLLNLFSLAEGEKELDINSVLKKLKSVPETVKPKDNVVKESATTEKQEEISAPVKNTDEVNKNIPASKEPVVQEKNNDELPDIDLIKNDWKKIVDEITSANPRIGVIEYGQPSAFSNEGKLKIKFDKKHSVYMNLCDTKKPEIEELINKFYDTNAIKIDIVGGRITSSERIISIKPVNKRSFEEKKNEILKEAPHLKFLFEDPLNCKFID